MSESKLIKINENKIRKAIEGEMPLRGFYRFKIK